jgi:hypothetical protein
MDSEAIVETFTVKAARLRRLGFSESEIAKHKPRKPKKRGAVPSEYEEQKDLIKQCDGAWGRERGIQGLLVAVPNSGHANNIARAAMLKATGLRTGFPDVFLPVARGKYHALAIELKKSRDELGRQTASADPDQVKWLNKLRAQGWYAEVAHGAKEAIAIIDAYLGGKL